MAAIKALETSAEKWGRRAGMAADDLIKGVKSPRRPWMQSSIDADPNYRLGVTQAASAGRYAGGVRRAGEEKWRSMTESKAMARYPEGVTLAVGEWQKGFQPFQSAYAALSLPPRGPRRAPGNLARSALVSRTFGEVYERLSAGARA